MTQFQPVEIVGDPGPAPVIFLCDHAANTVPDCVGGGSLGLADTDMARHIAYDIGGRGLTLALAAEMGAVAVLSRFSRLVIDPNRGEDDPTLVMRLYYGTLIPENRHITDAEISRRVDAFYRPYHRAVTTVIDAAEARGIDPILVSVHSFTPQLRGRAPRPWHVGVLSASDRRVADPLLDRLAAEPDLIVGDNEPYVGTLGGDCMDQHGLQRGLRHVLIEMRNDLITDAQDQKTWAARLAAALSDTIETQNLKEAV